MQLQCSYNAASHCKQGMTYVNTEPAYFYKLKVYLVMTPRMLDPNFKHTELRYSNRSTIHPNSSRRANARSSNLNTQFTSSPTLNNTLQEQLPTKTARKKEKQSRIHREQLHWLLKAQIFPQARAKVWPHYRNPQRDANSLFSDWRMRDNGDKALVARSPGWVLPCRWTLSLFRWGPQVIWTERPGR